MPAKNRSLPVNTIAPVALSLSKARRAALSSRKRGVDSAFTLGRLRVTTRGFQ